MKSTGIIITLDNVRSGLNKLVRAGIIEPGEAAFMANSDIMENSKGIACRTTFSANLSLLQKLKELHHSWAKGKSPELDYLFKPARKAGMKITFRKNEVVMLGWRHKNHAEILRGMMNALLKGKK